MLQKFTILQKFNYNTWSPTCTTFNLTLIFLSIFNTLYSQNPPNFRLKSDFSTYQKPVATVVEPSPSESSSNNDEDQVLVDFSDNQAQQQLNTSSSSSNNDSFHQQQQQQQYMYIQQLLQEIERLRSELDRLKMDVRMGIFKIKLSIILPIEYV